MMSFRAVSRALPSSLARTRASITTRALSSLRRPTATQQLWKASTLPLRSAFSTGLPRFADTTTESEIDAELSSTLATELQLEQESTEGLPEQLSEFLERSGFSLKDEPGNEEVSLIKQFGSEKITVTFSVADLNTEHDPDSYLQDQAMQDEAFDTDIDGETSKKPINAGNPEQFDTAPEDSVAAVDRDSTTDADAEEATFPCNINITVEKAGAQGAMQFVTSASDGQIMIDRFCFFRDAALADAQTADQQWAGRNTYSGPPFGNLDERLQEILERYLDERGVNTALALWIPEYIDYKEQQEYMKWLADTKEFVDA